MNDIFIIILLILLNGVFSMSEIALIAARKSRLIADAKRGSRGAVAAMRLADDPDRFLSTIQIGITLIGILTGIYSGATLAEDVGNILYRFGLELTVARRVGQVVIVIVVTYLSIVAGELVPKRIGMAASDAIARLISRPMRVLSVVAMPAVWLLSVSTSVIVKLLGLEARNTSVTEDEIKTIIHDGAAAGEVQEVERDIMERALVLGDQHVSSIMTPKGDVVCMRLDMSADDVRAVLACSLHNAYPVYCNESHAGVCGVVSLKSLVLSLGDPNFVLSEVVVEPMYFPESMSVYDALERMRSQGVHFALVCDEFGDMSGVLTQADILDGLVGSVSHPVGMPGIIQTAVDNEWIVDASLPLYDVLRCFGLEEFYVPAGYSTLAGLILEELRHVPVAGEHMEWHGVCIEVLTIAGARIGKVRLRVPSKTRQIV
ncbi:MAG: hemolysin family protein [Muribaculaceae bacterium]|nr:hemolysin family protein [Muribaculaceae bacterium]